MRNVLRKTRLFLVPVYLLVTMVSCYKDEPDCFDRKLYNKHKNDYCTLDCYSALGCDGTIYCNECEANSKGIRIVD